MRKLLVGAALPLTLLSVQAGAGAAGAGTVGLYPDMQSVVPRHLSRTGITRRRF